MRGGLHPLSYRSECVFEMLLVSNERRPDGEEGHGQW